MQPKTVTGRGWRGTIRAYRTAVVADVVTTDHHYRGTAPVMQAVYFPASGGYRWRYERPGALLARAVERVLFAAHELSKTRR